MNRELMVSAESIKDRIHTVRGIQVIIDYDLAELYGVETKQLNRAVKRNIERFPKEFMFQLNDFEYKSLRFQFGTLKTGRGKHRKYLPYVFTEQGVAMLSAVLNSEIAAKVSVQIMGAFVAMRKFLLNNAQIFQRIDKEKIRNFYLQESVDSRKIYKCKEYIFISNPWIVSMIPGDRKVARCINISNGFGGLV